ncbi:hypothetical protein M0813_00116 [Anaeramoeba flamelloides]|uniref:Uncharacterized protein n=1 Tax=Anaeramoeba flamelloides TaxID=1746091 RepID=A0ABQ8YWB1_9EUKA|nr:hypothetical protein M0813_00116 [Anaeramoeba flamelloides]
MKKTKTITINKKDIQTYLASRNNSKIIQKTNQSTMGEEGIILEPNLKKTLDQKLIRYPDDNTTHVSHPFCHYIFHHMYIKLFNVKIKPIAHSIPSFLQNSKLKCRTHFDLFKKFFTVDYKKIEDIKLCSSCYAQIIALRNCFDLKRTNKTRLFYILSQNHLDNIYRYNCQKDHPSDLVKIFSPFVIHTHLNHLNRKKYNIISNFQKRITVKKAKKVKFPIFKVFRTNTGKKKFDIDWYKIKNSQLKNFNDHIGSGDQGAIAINTLSDDNEKEEKYKKFDNLKKKERKIYRKIKKNQDSSVYPNQYLTEDSESLESESDSDSDLDYKSTSTYLYNKSIKNIKEKKKQSKKEIEDDDRIFKIFDKYKQKSTQKIILNTDLEKFDCTRIKNFNLKKNLDKSQFEIINLQIEKKLTKGVVDRFLKILYDTVERSPNLNTLYRSERTLLTNCWKEFEFCHFDSPVLTQKNNSKLNIKGDFEIKTPVIKVSQSIRQFLSVDRFSNLFSKQIEHGTSPNKKNFKAQQFTSFQNYKEKVLDNCEEDEIPICISFYYDHHYCNNKISIGGLYFLIENIPVCWRSRKETIF